MSDKKPFYITTAIAYANAAPHIGHAFEYVTADVHARYAKSLGGKVYFVTGMDEHGQKIEGKAKAEGVDVQAFVDKYASTFKELDKLLGVEYDFFVRTSDKEKHHKGAQMLWNKLSENGDLEKRSYKALYCVGCEEFKTDKDLNEKGECPIHLKTPEIVEEENYFFKLSKYGNDIKGKIESGELAIYPDTRKNEILALIDRGLEDVSFSRPVSKVSWGIPVPGDDTQVMYVWCDALSNYITALGYGTNEFRNDLWENATHVIGKDILRFHAAIWPGMLLSAGLPLPKRILVHGHITSGGQKMSKTLGNVIDPQHVIELFKPATEYAGEAARFILLHEVPSFEDGDITTDSIKAAYLAYLVNGVGNLTSRIMKLSSTYLEKMDIEERGFDPVFHSHLSRFDTSQAVRFVMDKVRELDLFIQTTEAFKVVKVDEDKGKELIKEYVILLNHMARMLNMYMPQTSAKIMECVRENKMPEKPLFARI
jgi:methionyl-tRNA synthetase